MAIPFHDRRTGEVLYHGTTHPFNAGDMVTPQGDEPYAFATPDLSYATERSHEAHTYAWNQKSREGGHHYPEWKESNPPRVFEVEPSSDMFFHPDNPDAAVTRTGFRVKREVKR